MVAKTIQWFKAINKENTHVPSMFMYVLEHEIMTDHDYTGE
jgi:hypothetical protein